MTEQQLRQLAADLPKKANRDQQGKGLSKAFYFFNPNHPAIEPLYKRYLEKIGAKHGGPISDAERTYFELAMLNKAAREAIMAYCYGAGADWEQKEKTHCPPAQR